MIAFVAGGPSYPLSRVSGLTEPNWDSTIGAATPDNHLTWQALYDLDENPWTIEPLPGRAETQADSTAADVAGLRAEFNALLAKMRRANLLAP
jgi:hypothetical protein